MAELVIKFEVEKDKEAFAASVLSAVNEGVLDESDANTIERTGDTLFFTRQEVPETKPVAVHPDVEVNTENNAPFTPLNLEELVDNTETTEANDSEEDSELGSFNKEEDEE